MATINKDQISAASESMTTTFEFDQARVLYASDATAAVKEIKAARGRVSQVVEPDLLLAILPEDFDVATLTSSTATMPNDLSESSKKNLELLNKAIRHYSRGQPITSDRQPPHDPHALPCVLKEDKFDDGKKVSNIGPNWVFKGNVRQYIVVLSCSTGPRISDSQWGTVDKKAIGANSFWAANTRATFSSSSVQITIPGATFVPNTPIGFGPSAVVLGDELWCFYHSDRSSDWTRLCYKRLASPSGQWSSEQNLGTNRGYLSYSPSAVEYNNEIWVFYQDKSASGAVLYSVYSGTSKAWRLVDQHLNQSAMSWSPCAVSFAGNLWVFYANKYGEHNIMYSVYDPKTKLFNPEQTVKSPSGVIAGTFQTMSASQAGGKLKLYHLTFNKHTLRCDIFDPATSTWTVGTQDLPGMLASGGITTLSRSNYVYTYHQATGNGNSLWTNIQHDSEWAGDVEAEGSTISYCPSVIGWKDSRGVPCMWVFMRDPDNGGLKWRHFYYQSFLNGWDYSKWDLMESVWRDPALAQFGQNPGLQGMQAMAMSLVNATFENAYVLWVVPFKLAHYAYSRVRSMSGIINYENGNWGPDQLDRTIAHETGHLFQAQDEYEGSCDTVSGINNVKNGNCVNCPNGTGGKECIMNKDSWKVCQWTLGQVGLPYSRPK